MERKTALALNTASTEQAPRAPPSLVIVLSHLLASYINATLSDEAIFIFNFDRLQSELSQCNVRCSFSAKSKIFKFELGAFGTRFCSPKFCGFNLQFRLIIFRNEQKLWNIYKLWNYCRDFYFCSRSNFLISNSEALGFVAPQYHVYYCNLWQFWALSQKVFHTFVCLPYDINSKCAWRLWTWRVEWCVQFVSQTPISTLLKCSGKFSSKIWKFIGKNLCSN